MRTLRVHPFVHMSASFQAPTSDGASVGAGLAAGEQPPPAAATEASAAASAAAQPPPPSQQLTLENGSKRAAKRATVMQAMPHGQELSLISIMLRKEGTGHVRQVYKEDTRAIDWREASSRADDGGVISPPVAVNPAPLFGSGPPKTLVDPNTLLNPKKKKKNPKDVVRHAAQSVDAVNAATRKHTVAQMAVRAARRADGYCYEVDIALPTPEKLALMNAAIQKMFENPPAAATEASAAAAAQPPILQLRAPRLTAEQAHCWVYHEQKITKELASAMNKSWSKYQLLNTDVIDILTYFGTRYEEAFGQTTAKGKALMMLREVVLRGKGPVIVTGDSQHADAACGGDGLHHELMTEDCADAMKIVLDPSDVSSQAGVNVKCWPGAEFVYLEGVRALATQITFTHLVHTRDLLAKLMPKRQRQGSKPGNGKSKRRRTREPVCAHSVLQERFESMLATMTPSALLTWHTRLGYKKSNKEKAIEDLFKHLISQPEPVD